MHTVPDMSEKKPARRPETVSVPVRLPVSLNDQIDQSASAIGLSKQDTMRLSLERGLKILTAQLGSQPDKAAA